MKGRHFREILSTNLSRSSFVSNFSFYTNRLLSLCLDGVKRSGEDPDPVIFGLPEPNLALFFTGSGSYLKKRSYDMTFIFGKIFNKDQQIQVSTGMTKDGL